MRRDGASKPQLAPAGSHADRNNRDCPPEIPRGLPAPFRCDYCGSNQRGPDPFPLSIRPNAEWAQDQYVDKLSPCVEPPKAQPDMADRLNPVDGDETRLREPSGNHVAPQRSDIPVVSKRLGD